MKQGGLVSQKSFNYGAVKVISPKIPSSLVGRMIHFMKKNGIKKTLYSLFDTLRFEELVSSNKAGLSSINPFSAIIDHNPRVYCNKKP